MPRANTVGLMVGLDDLRGLSSLNDPVILTPILTTVSVLFIWGVNKTHILKSLFVLCPFTAGF